MLAKDVLELQVAASPDSVAVARHAVVDHLVRRGVPTTVVDDIELVTSELVTNAIVHPRPVLDHRHVHLRVAVTDAIELSVANVGSAAAIPPVEHWHAAPAFAASGRGLGIVRRLSDAVSVEQQGGRAIVTCRRRLPDRGAMP